jgi:antirestriction protein ArdC
MTMRNLYREVTDRILTELKAGTAPWIQPWKEIRQKGAAPVALPRNAMTGRLYSGVNIWLLWIAADKHGWTDGRFLTFKQALEAKGNVRKGEHGTKVYFVKQLTVQDREKPDDSDATRTIPMLREYTVFNVAQCENLPEKLIAAADPVKIPAEPSDNDEFCQFIAATGADVQHGGNRACYIPSMDRIQMPLASQFRDTANYRATLAHELVHWTGPKKRLDREHGKRFGDSGYALEELTAELGAAILCAEFGIAGELQHPAYIANWIKALEDSDHAFFAAASAASKAVEFLRDKVSAEEPEEFAIAA